MDNSIAEVLRVAKEYDIPFEVKEGFLDEEDYYLLHIPSGSDKRIMYLTSPETARTLLDAEFHKLSLISDYEAIADLKSGYIEAGITSRDIIGATSLLERRLKKAYGQSRITEIDLDETTELELKVSNSDGVTLEISQASPRLVAMSRSINRISIKISLGKEVTHDAARRSLQSLSNSLFFQIEMESDIGLSLRKELKRRPGSKVRKRVEESSILQFPVYEYDEAPISLYWYAKGARAMPLLQYLAYYQVVEYYFPNFTKLEAVRRARKILKTPTFRVDREADLTQLISEISLSGKAGGSEREQLKITIGEVLTNDDVASFFSHNEDISSIVSKKQKGITDKTINLQRKEHDHRPDIAELLYDIRCRIVHTKNDSVNFQSDMLLPFSKAEEGLWPYITIMQFVARHSLIRSSFPLIGT